MNTKNLILEVVRYQDYQKGEDYPSSYIQKVRTTELPHEVIHLFKVKSTRDHYKYSVTVGLNEDGFSQVECECPQFRLTKSCKHVAAALLKYEDDIFNVDNENRVLKISHDILDSLASIHTGKSQKKELLTFELELSFTDTYYGKTLFIKPRIGLDKLYVVTPKIGDFFSAFVDQEKAVYFGKQFTYHPKEQYFDSEDTKILKFLGRIYEQNKYYRELSLLNDEIPMLLKLLEKKNFTVHMKGLFHGIHKENPFYSTLTKEENLYHYSLGDFDQIEPLTEDGKYIIKEENVYELPDDVASILAQFIYKKIDILLFEEKDLPSFIRGILPHFKKNMIIDEMIKDEVKLIEPIPKLYLDIKGETLFCDLHFDYNGKTIDYFKPSSIENIRNEGYEAGVLKNIESYGFVCTKEHLEINDLDAIGTFIQDSLKQLSAAYEVFTTTELQNISIIQNTHVASQFSVGQDHIMKYYFTTDGIDAKELNGVFQAMKLKKKYYRLKSGKILDMRENKGLEQLRDLVYDMDLSLTEVKEGMGVIPKYRAIYLDSLREKKYSIIETNRVFDDFIKKFTMYQKVDVYLSETDKTTLRDYQVSGVKWLYNIYKCGLGGILADEMGLGKSIQIIYFLKQLIKENKDAKFLIIAPTSLIYNWENEFDKFGNELKYQVIAEAKNKREELLTSSDTNIFITTYGLVRQDREIYEQFHFECLILDEAQAIKNTMAGISKVVKKLDATTKLALTGTPIENTVMELWSIFDFIMPGYLVSLTKFQSKYNIKNITEENIALKSLNIQISPFILRRKKVDVAKDLPLKIENNIYVELNSKQKVVYVGELEKSRKEMNEAIAAEGFKTARFKILQLLMKLRQICIDPKIVYENYKGGSTKIEELISLVKEIIQNGHKILLFTSFRSALDIVQEEFSKHQITSYIITGSVPSRKRKEMVDQFNEDDTNVFLIMLKAGGTGLNLTGADVVIHLDLWWNPQVENQATDRAHRIGQTHNVEVIKLICRGTIEERILELQQKKKVLSDVLIEDENRDKNIISHLSEEDIKNLLAYDGE